MLVVEDTPFFRDLEKTYFESVGFRVTLANNGQEALDLFLERPNYYNLVVSDIVMPVMDGYELVKSIKSSEKLGHIPVIALTSFTEEQSREKALSAGFDGYAIKTNKENILRSVEQFLMRGVTMLYSTFYLGENQNGRTHSMYIRNWSILQFSSRSGAPEVIDG